MSLVIGKSSGGSQDFGRIEDGTYVARLVQVIDLGQQEITDWKTKEFKGYGHRLWIVFEFPTEKITINGEERPRWQGREYALSFHEKSGLTKLVNALDPQGKAKTLPELLGSPAMVTIGSTSGNNAKIENVVSLPKGFQVDDLENPAKALDLSEPDLEVFESLPDWLKEKITSSKDFEKTRLAELLTEGGVKEEAGENKDEEFDDDIPF